MPELRKRKVPGDRASKPPKRAKSLKPPHGAEQQKNNGLVAEKVEVGNSLKLDGFGGEINTHDGESTTLQSLVQKSDNGVVLFTYPKASTPGCMSLANPKFSKWKNSLTSKARHNAGLLISG